LSGTSVWTVVANRPHRGVASFAIFGQNALCRPQISRHRLSGRWCRCDRYLSGPPLLWHPISDTWSARLRRSSIVPTLPVARHVRGFQHNSALADTDGSSVLSPERM